jgi:hypothetical protein
MVGGLIQIASYGIHDIFLIGNPQITFFKTVYRRYTNYSMEYLEEQLIGQHNFGGYLTSNLSKSGDLLHKLYLKINIPIVSIDINNSIYKNSNNNNKFDDDYKKLNIFFNSINFNLILQLYKLLSLTNLKYSDVETEYLRIKNKINYTEILNKIDINLIFNKTIILPFQKIIKLNQQINMKSLLDFDIYYKNNINKNSDIKYVLTSLLNNYYSLLKVIKENLNDKSLFNKKLDDINNRKNLNFAWVEFIGQQIINKVEIEIGGKIIDFTDAIKMNIDYQLSNKKFHDETYYKMIGNVSELTTFNYNIKSSYNIYIPLDFWFSKNSGLSIPLIFLRYHDVKVNILLNNLCNCCYYDKLKSNILIEDLIKLDSVSLIANYIYLDTDERKKFAQLSHEYLINQNQVVKYNNVINGKFNVELPFFNPIKQLYWVARNNDNITRLKYFEYSNSYYVDIYEFLNNEDGVVQIKTVQNQTVIKIGDIIEICYSIYYSGIYNVLNVIDNNIYIKFDIYIEENYKYNYSLINNNYVKTSDYSPNSQSFIYKKINSNPILQSTLELNGIQRFYKIDNIYTNFVQPYQFNSRSPEYGLNSYSFALYPEEYQPSGFCNFNQLDLKILTCELNNIREHEVLIYANSYNLLKFEFGKAGILLNI